MAKVKKKIKSKNKLEKSCNPCVGFRKIWLVLLPIVAIVLFVVGIVMLIADGLYLNAIAYILSSIFMITAFYLLLKNQILFTNASSYDVFFNLGFVFLIIGHNMNLGIWGLGAVFFLTSLFNKYKENK